MAYLQSIPAELFDVIVSSLPADADRVNILKCCRILRLRMTPILYKNIVPLFRHRFSESTNKLLALLKVLCDRDFAVHVRTLRLECMMHSSRILRGFQDQYRPEVELRWRTREMAVNIFNTALAEALKGCRSLREFSYAIEVEMSPEVIVTIAESCPLLEHLEISQSGWFQLIDEEGTTKVPIWVPLTPLMRLSHIKVLRLHHMIGMIQDIVCDLGRTLAGLPNLTELAVGFREDVEHHHVRSEGYKNRVYRFLPLLRNSYVSHTSHRIPLQKLALGRDVDIACAHEFLNEVIDDSALKVLHFTNALMKRTCRWPDGVLENTRLKEFNEDFHHDHFTRELLRKVGSQLEEYYTRMLPNGLRLKDVWTCNLKVLGIFEQNTSDWRYQSFTSWTCMFPNLKEFAMGFKDSDENDEYELSRRRQGLGESVYKLITNPMFGETVENRTMTHFVQLEELEVFHMPWTTTPLESFIPEFLNTYLEVDMNNIWNARPLPKLKYVGCGPNLAPEKVYKVVDDGGYNRSLVQVDMWEVEHIRIFQAAREFIGISNRYR